MDKLLSSFARLYQTEIRLLEHLHDPFLLLVRLLWGTQFVLTGWGKLTNLDRVAAWFGDDLGIPMPWLNALMAAGTELGGGLLLALGIGGRLTPLPLIFVMCVAWLTSDWEAITKSTPLAPDPFLESAPFLFWFAAVIVLLFGPGRWSADHQIGRWWRRRQPESV